MVIERKELDRIVLASICSYNEKLKITDTHWSGFITEREFTRICGTYNLKSAKADRCEIYSLMNCIYTEPSRNETLPKAIEEAERVGASSVTHGAIPVTLTGRLLHQDFIIYNKAVMREQAMKTLPPRPMTKDYRAYRLICSMGYCFNVDLNRFINVEESAFNQLVNKQ